MLQLFTEHAKSHFSQEKGEEEDVPGEKQELTLPEFMRKETLGRERTGKNQNHNDLQGFYL